MISTLLSTHNTKDTIRKLFLIHNIKYIISVDDCFLVHKREEMEAVVYSEMCMSLNPFKDIL